MLKFAQSFLQRSRSQKSEKSQGLTYQFLMETSNVGQNWILKQYSAAEESIHWENNLFSVSRGTMKFSLLAPPGNIPTIGEKKLQYNGKNSICQSLPTSLTSLYYTSQAKIED